MYILRHILRLDWKHRDDGKNTLWYIWKAIHTPWAHISDVCNSTFVGCCTYSKCKKICSNNYIEDQIYDAICISLFLNWVCGLASKLLCWQLLCCNMPNITNSTETTMLNLVSNKNKIQRILMMIKTIKISNFEHQK